MVEAGIAMLRGEKVVKEERGRANTGHYIIGYSIDNLYNLNHRYSRCVVHLVTKSATPPSPFFLTGF